MDDPQIDGLLRQLGSRDPRGAWTHFLEIYSPLLLDVVRLFEREQDAVADCYVFICDRLSRNNFRRLRRFAPHGPARFSTWLVVVARNLCLDWHRHQVGRERVFESVSRMPVLEQEMFRSLFVELVPAEELFLRLKHRFPALTASQVAEAVARVERTLTSRQRWLLMVRRNRALAAAAPLGGHGDEELLRIPSELPNPESWTSLQEERSALLRAMAELSPRDRLLIQLRYGRDLTLDEIARLNGFENLQVANRRLRDAVEKLRTLMTARGGKPRGPSV
ncbi:MAG: sigma-70 family RNA polymerase sigma factor [Bacteroidales bacterium]